MTDKSTKEEVAEELTDKAIVKALEERLALEDLFPLYAAFRDTEATQIRIESMSVQLKQLNKDLDEARRKLNDLNAKVNEKYSLDPSLDRIDIHTGLISRG